MPPRIKPILFNTQMVQAIMDGCKTMTRRVIKYVPKCYKGIYSKPCDGGVALNTAANCLYCTECGNIIEYSPEGKDYVRTVEAPFRNGDVLWVRETWQLAYDLDGNDQIIEDTGRYCFAASPETHPNITDWVRDDGTHIDHMLWRPSIHMPKEAARIFLCVKSVQAERLQDITDEQARNEGVQRCKEPRDTFSGAIEKQRFQDLWDSLNAKRDCGWDANPWVWVIEFERCDRPADFY